MRDSDSASRNLTQLKQRIFALSNAGRDVPQEMLQEATELMRQTGRYDQIDVDDNDERQGGEPHPCHLTTLLPRPRRRALPVLDALLTSAYVHQAEVLPLMTCSALHGPRQE